MKTLGLLGGLSWESTLEYYRLLNEGVRARLGGLHSAKCLLYSFDFAPMVRLQEEENLTVIAREMTRAAQTLERAGAEALIICSNTSHCVADEVAAGVRIPLLHVADALGRALKRDRRKTIGFLGTRYTMDPPFYRERLEKQGLTVLLPEAEDRRALQAIIYDELCLGNIRPESKAALLKMIRRFREQGAEAAVLGCTELGLLVKPDDTEAPLYDTLKIHAEAAVDHMLASESPAPARQRAT